MSSLKAILLTAVFAFPLLSFSVTTEAATAHNLQTGARTKNVNDSAMTARMKQTHMKRHRRY